MTSKLTGDKAKEKLTDVKSEGNRITDEASPSQPTPCPRCGSTDPARGILSKCDKNPHSWHFARLTIDKPVSVKQALDKPSADQKAEPYYDKFGRLNWTYPVNVRHLILQLQTLDPEMKVSSVHHIEMANGSGTKARAYGLSMSRERWGETGWLDFSRGGPECLAIWAQPRRDGLAGLNPEPELREQALDKAPRKPSAGQPDVVTVLEQLLDNGGDIRGWIRAQKELREVRQHPEPAPSEPKCARPGCGDAYGAPSHNPHNWMYHEFVKGEHPEPASDLRSWNGKELRHLTRACADGDHNHCGGVAKFANADNTDDCRTCNCACHGEHTEPAPSHTEKDFEHAVGCVNRSCPICNEFARQIDARHCKDCAEAARQSYSEATTPGFFFDKCAKHRKGEHPEPAKGCGQ